MLNSMLEQMDADIRRQNQAAGNVLEQNIQDNKSAKEQMEDSLAKVLADIDSQDRNMVSLKIAIEVKKGLISVAQTQLAVRSQRPRKELCHDPAQVQLLAEVQEHSAYIKRLSGYLSQADMELQALNRTQLFLEQKIQDKSLSLDIDQAIYVQLFQTIAVYTF
ncbi:hypothetical protein AAFF_G00025020 [Aldrovandia affinis]|uniref:Tektin n=1 Tax=Aldrovandia affinis TaxID=143900 RepID=A0AAD7T5U9_9TELE|nr:hypothetical protein AAFF_G00025020 [Aldrovandia affinis]